MKTPFLADAAYVRALIGAGTLLRSSTIPGPHKWALITTTKNTGRVCVGGVGHYAGSDLPRRRLSDIKG